MSDVKDGGPAFPIFPSIGHHFDGMPLRDYFAAKAMQGVLAASAFNNVVNGELEDPTLHYMQNVAAVSFQMADAMLAAREVKP